MLPPKKVMYISELVCLQKVKIVVIRLIMFSNSGAFNIIIFNTIPMLPQAELERPLGLTYLHFITLTRYFVKPPL